MKRFMKYYVCKYFKVRSPPQNFTLVQRWEVYIQLFSLHFENVKNNDQGSNRYTLFYICGFTELSSQQDLI